MSVRGWWMVAMCGLLGCESTAGNVFDAGSDSRYVIEHRDASPSNCAPGGDHCATGERCAPTTVYGEPDGYRCTATPGTLAVGQACSVTEGLSACGEGLRCSSVDSQAGVPLDGRCATDCGFTRTCDAGTFCHVNGACISDAACDPATHVPCDPLDACWDGPEGPVCAPSPLSAIGMLQGFSELRSRAWLLQGPVHAALRHRDALRGWF